MSDEPRDVKPHLIDVSDGAALGVALANAGLGRGRPVVVLIGGAANLDSTESVDLESIVRDGVIATAQAAGAIVIDGGTDAGVMALAGQAHREISATFPLLGVAPIGRVSADGIEGAVGTTRLEPNHTHVVLTPGDVWGAEVTWLIDAARLLSAGQPVVAVIVDGGQVAGVEATKVQAEGWPLIALAGSGRTADDLARIAQQSRGGDLGQGGRGGIVVCDVGGGGAGLARTLRSLLGASKMRVIQFPALYVAASEASKRGQRWFKTLTALELVFVLAGLGLAIVGGLTLVHHGTQSDIGPTISITGIAGSFFLALLVKLVGRAVGYDEDWYTGRAVAEAVRSEAWRYMTRAAPYGGDDADDRFGARIAILLQRAKDIRQAVDRLPSRPQQISASMREVRALDLAGRRDAYSEERLEKQTAWYAHKSAAHHRASSRWFWLTIAFQLAAVVCAFLALHLIDEEVAGQLFLRLMAFCGSLAIAFTAWTQLNRDEELSKAYAFSLQELALASGAAERVRTDEELADVVREGEEVIGRENRGWLAKRAELVESPAFGHSD